MSYAPLTTRELAGFGCVSEMECRLLATIADRDAAIRERDEAIRILGNKVQSDSHLLACYRLKKRPTDAAIDVAGTTSADVAKNPLARQAVLSKSKTKEPYGGPMCMGCLGTGFMEGVGKCPACKGSGECPHARRAVGGQT